MWQRFRSNMTSQPTASSHLAVIYASVRQPSKLGTVTSKWRLQHTMHHVPSSTGTGSVTITHLQYLTLDGETLNSTQLLFTKDQVGNLPRRALGWVVGGTHEHREMAAAAPYMRCHMRTCPSTQHELIGRSHHSMKWYPPAFKPHVSASDLKKPQPWMAAIKACCRMAGGAAPSKGTWARVHTTAGQEKEPWWEFTFVWVLPCPWTADSSCTGFQETRIQFISRK